ncbi:MAG TPA: pteridine reductase [Xanthomonadaceae bacterium]|jgi:pteridine reductase|nr:pteridine reductase [Xanthomonadaceae bacterium]
MPSERPVALITGASRRIGAAIARRLHEAGYDLALHHRRDDDRMDALVAELETGRPGSTLELRAELADMDDLPLLIGDVIMRFERIDVLVNNASAFFPTTIGETTPQQWDTIFAANARAPFFLSQAAAPHLRATGGSIINLVDIYAERPLKDYTLYCMAKAALVMLTMSLAKELGPEVRVNGIAPGAVLWPEAGIDSERQQKLIAKTALKRAGDPQDVAEAALYLIRDARYTTGEILRVDGGRTLAI